MRRTSFGLVLISALLVSPLAMARNKLPAEIARDKRVVLIDALSKGIESRTLELNWRRPIGAINRLNVLGSLSRRQTIEDVKTLRTYLNVRGERWLVTKFADVLNDGRVRTSWPAPPLKDALSVAETVYKFDEEVHDLAEHVRAGGELKRLSAARGSRLQGKDE